MNNHKHTFLWLVIFLLLIAFFVRAHHVTALPPFNDESHHIRRAEQVWTFENPDLSFTVGKLLTYYWIGMFHPARLDAIFVSRTVMGLFALLGLAAAYAVGRRLFGAWAGILAVYMLAFAPFMVFFDRMALADPLTTALGMLTIWASLVMFDHPRQWAWTAGLLATFTILAKLTGLPFAGVPVVAIAILSTDSWREKWHRYRRALLIFYATIILILTPFFLRIVYEEFFGIRISVVDTHLINTRSPIETLLDNLRDLWRANLILNGGGFVIFAVLIILIALCTKPRLMMFAIGCTGLAWSMTVILSGVLSTRYLQLGIPPLFILISGGMVVSLDYFFARFAFKTSAVWMISWLAATIWIAFFAQPFVLNSWNAPLQNYAHLPERDQWEYYKNFTAGYGLMDAAEIMPTLEPAASGRIPVIGLVGSCHQIRLYLDEFGPVYLECPAFGWQGEFMDTVADYIDQRLQEEGILYMLVEPQLPYTDLSKLHVRHQLIGRFERPFAGMRVELWRVFEGG